MHLSRFTGCMGLELTQNFNNSRRYVTTYFGPKLEILFWDNFSICSCYKNVIDEKNAVTAERPMKAKKASIVQDFKTL